MRILSVNFVYKNKRTLKTTSVRLQWFQLKCYVLSFEQICFSSNAVKFGRQCAPSVRST